MRLTGDRQGGRWGEPLLSKVGFASRAVVWSPSIATPGSVHGPGSTVAAVRAIGSRAAVRALSATHRISTDDEPSSSDGLGADGAADLMHRGPPRHRQLSVADTHRSGAPDAVGASFTRRLHRPLDEPICDGGIRHPGYLTHQVTFPFDLSKFVVVVYSDLTPWSSIRLGRFDSYLDDYRHHDPSVPLQVVATYGSPWPGEDDLRATLFELATEDHAHPG